MVTEFIKRTPTTGFSCKEETIKTQHTCQLTLSKGDYVIIEGVEYKVYITSGFADVHDNVVTVCAES